MGAHSGHPKKKSDLLKPEPLLELVQLHKWDEVLPQLQERSLDEINQMANYGLSLLHLAAISGHVKAVRFLLSKGVDVNISDASQHTPVGFAAAGGYLECVQELVKNKADINTPDIHGHGPLYACAVRNHLEVVKYLVSQGVNLTQKEADTNRSILCLVEQSKAADVAAYFKTLPEFS